MTQRQTIMSAVVSRMQTILKASAYNTDLGKAVYHCKVDALPSGVTACIVADGRDSIDMDVVGMHTHSLEVKVFGTSTLSGGVDVTTAYAILEDILKAIGVDQAWGIPGVSTRIDSAEVDVNVEEQVIMGAAVTMVITYRTARFTL